jgi:hypothetical protein
MVKLDHVGGVVIANVSAKNHVFVKIARIKNARGKPNFLDVRVDMIFAL